jgi:hypothetical protein
MAGARRGQGISAPPMVTSPPLGVKPNRKQPPWHQKHLTANAIYNLIQ